ncbi:putative ABC transporter permease [Clostridium sp. HBUAS56017]|uniref:putative ABC transporter permease n=1 Tax=Clostridium sp. HBUAS56017 TaxID=2571128 RepID=UPI0011775713|nr:putative ABC transporter permease [Clostridium sp. HBUAS56017]
MDWLLYFAFVFEVYCFLGWCLEEGYSYYIMGHFKKDGFLKGPFKPMYGFAICILIYFYYVREVSYISLAILFIVVPTLIEYISGHLLKKCFGKAYWDYSKIKYNFQGVICARFSICWAILVFFTLIILNPLIDHIYFNFVGVLSKVVPAIGIYMIIDTYFTVRQISYSKINAS